MRSILNPTLQTKAITKQTKLHPSRKLRESKEINNKTDEVAGQLEHLTTKKIFLISEVKCILLRLNNKRIEVTKDVIKNNNFSLRFF